MRLLFIALMLLCATQIQAQELINGNKAEASKTRSFYKFICGNRIIDSPKGQFYIGFGYNKEWYTKSNINVKDAAQDDSQRPS
jgi:hypothetical protein